METETVSTSAVYNLLGQQTDRLSKPQKGIYIKGGKKVIIK